MKRTRGLAVLMTCAVLPRMAPAFAGPVDPDLAAARALFHEAEQDEQAGRWAEALTKLRRASTVKMTPGIRFHIALCEERTGHLVAALDDYTAAQAAARVEDNRDVLSLVSEPLLAIKVRVPTLTVDLPPGIQGAEVRLDGSLMPAASVGTPVPIDVGSHTLQATAPGQAPYAVTVTLVERQAQAVHIQFTALAPAVTGPTPAQAPGRSSAGGGAQGSRILAVVATGTAVVLVGGGIGAYAAAGSDQSYWQLVCKGQGPSCGNPTPVRAWDATALGAWIAGAGAGALAVVLWVKPGAKGEGAQAELRGGPGSLWLTGSF